MAISVKNYADRPNTQYIEFVVDTIADINLLPTTTTRAIGQYEFLGTVPMGSSAYCFEDGKVYGLSSTGWKVM